VIQALIQTTERNKGASFDITLRHAILSAFDRIVTVEQALSWSEHSSSEVRLLGVIILRKKEHPGVAEFLNDSSRLVRIESIRAIYDTSVVDESVGARLLQVSYKGLPVFIQSRLLVAAARWGTADGFARVLDMAMDSSLDSKVQNLAFRALEQWDEYPSMDPILGSFRPSSHPREKSRALSGKHASRYQSYLEKEKRTDFLTLATEVSAVLGIELNLNDLQNQVLNEGLTSKLRVAFFSRLLEAENGISNSLLLQLLKDSDTRLRALALGEPTHATLKNPLQRLKKQCVYKVYLN